MPKITSAKQYGLVAAASSGKSTKAKSLSAESAHKMLAETPPAKRRAFAKQLAKGRKKRHRRDTAEMRSFGGR